MTRISQLRSKLFAHKLTSSIGDNIIGSDRIDVLLTQARLSYETMLSQTNGEKIDQRRSAMKGQMIYRQGIVAPMSVVLILDINSNRQYHKQLLQQISQIIGYIITSCEQLGLECTIIYPSQGDIHEYICDGVDQTIQFLNVVIENPIQEDITPISISLNRYYNEYYDHQAIVLSDWYTRDPELDAQQSNNQLTTGQMIGYIRNYPSPIISRGATPHELIQLKR